MYDTLLFLHVLSAFCMVATVVMFSAFVLGGPVNGPTFLTARVLWGIGGVGTLVFGVWLAIYLDGYEIWSGWIIAALILWVLANGAGQKAESGIKELVTGNDAAIAVERRIAFAHWMRVVYVVALIVVMVWKPGA